MSNHFTGLNLGPPLGDQRLDLCDLYAFQSPADPARTVLILNANPSAEAPEFHPDAIYRLNIDNDGDCLTDIAFSYVFSPLQNGKQTANVFMAKGAEARAVEAVGTKIIADAEVSFGAKPNIVKSGAYTFFAGNRSDAFFFDYDGIKNLFDTKGGRNFTAPHLGGKSPWTGKDSNTESNVFSTVLELPTSELGAKPAVRIWGRCSVRRDGKLLHVDRAGHPVGQQLLQHRRDQRGIQRQRADQRSQALARSVRPPDGAYRQLHPGRSHRRDRRATAFCPTC